jgi:hypothetical protein
MINIDALNDEEKLAALESIHKSIAESKEIQRKKITTNVEMIVKALKKIEADLKQRYDETGQLIANLKNGEDGRDGKDGKDGKNGKDGRDGLMGPRGYDGAKGENGLDGADGVSVTDAHIDFDGSLIIHLSSGRVINVGEVVAADIAEKIKVITNGGGTSQGVLDAIASLQAQINAITGGLDYQGTWNASTNVPALASSVGTNGEYYVVSTAGSTNLNGVTDWQVGDWAIFNGSTWQKLDQTNLVTSVAGRTGAIVLTTSDIGGLGTIATQAANNVSITGGSITGITDLAIADGGTGASTAPNARINLGLVIGTDVLSPTGSAASLTSFPTFNQNTTGTAANVTGTVAIANGGTGQTTANAAFNALAPTQTGNSGKYLTTDGTNSSWATNPLGTVTSVGGTGTVSGISLSGTVTTSGNLTLGGTLDLSSPPAIGSTAANTGAFTTLTTSSTVTLNGGTANGVTYLNGSKVLTSGSALTFDGTNFQVGGNSQPIIRAVSSSTNNATARLFTDGDTVYIGSANTSTSGGSVPVVFQIGGSEGMRLTSTGLGIGASSVGAKLQVSGSGGGRLFIDNAASGANYYDATNHYFRGTSGTGDWMTINSSGNVGIGTSSPSYKLDVQSGTATIQIRSSTTSSGAIPKLRFEHAGNDSFSIVGGSYMAWLSSDTTERMRLDSSGNLGLGVTPSAWGTVYRKAIQVGTSASFAGVASGSSDYMSMLGNAYLDSGATYRYIYSLTAVRYEAIGGEHRWFNAPSGTAGNTISFTQAMTLDASGNLMLGGTSNKVTGLSGGGTGFTVQAASAPTIGVWDTSDASYYLQLGQVEANSYLWNIANGFLSFGTNNTERARIDSSGNLLVGTTSTINSAAFTVQKAVSSNNISVIDNSSATSPFGLQVRYSNAVPNGTANEFFSAYDFPGPALRFSARSNGGIANYSANDVNLSDRREKTNFAPAKSYLDVICAIPVQTFNYIDQNLEEDDGLNLGVVAQDVQAIAPELVMESNWGTKEEPKMRLSIYQTDLQYALMKALQELKAEFDAYKASHP